MSYLEHDEEKSFREIVKRCHETATEKGWWEPDGDGRKRSMAEGICLMHSELSEALEEDRKPDTPAFYIDKKGKPQGIVVEFADCIIRIFDTAEEYKLPLYEAMKKKMEYNRTRPHRHGGKKL